MAGWYFGGAAGWGRIPSLSPFRHHSRADLKKQPPTASHVRLLFGGQFLSDDTVLSNIPHFTTSDTPSIHVVIMAPPAADKGGAGYAAGEKSTTTGSSQRAASSGRCACVIS